MSGIAVAIDWERPEAGPEAVRRMLAAMPHRAPDGAAVAAVAHCALGHALRATTARERAAEQPLHHPALGLWLVADARLDNREELARSLGLAAPPASDAELLLRGFASLGAALASRLEGDFAFAVWEERRRVLTAARDAFGLRPLFHRAAGGGLLVASEVDALLAAGGGADVEESAVLDFLLRRRGNASGTFFRQIRRLPPGHVLEATAAGVRDLGQVRPPPLRPEAPPPGKEASGFRQRFRRAVAARLDAEGPVAAQLSGGLDSGAIACMAEDIYREDERERPPLVLLSAVLRGFPGDETRWLEAVLRRVRFRCEKWDASATGPAAPEPLPLAHPLRDPMPGGALRSLLAARAAGSRVLLAGLGGDELLFEGGVLEDLARRGRLLTLARETLLLRPYTATPGWRLFAGALRAAAPERVRRAWGSVRPHRPPPPWLGPGLRPLWPPPDPPRADPEPSRVQAELRSLLGGNEVFFGVEVAELAAARAGLQLRLPFLDRPLVEWVFAIPWERRLPGGLAKRLLRDAMAGSWPEALASRRRVALADEYLAWSVRRALPLFTPTIAGWRWNSEKFIIQEEARRLLASLRRGDPGNWRKWLQIWNIWSLESWLGSLGRQ